MGDHHDRAVEVAHQPLEVAGGRSASRCVSGSSSSSRSGSERGTAASATSLRWPPLRTSVGWSICVGATAQLEQQALDAALEGVAAGPVELLDQRLPGGAAPAPSGPGRRQRRDRPGAAHLVQLRLDPLEVGPGGAHDLARRARVGRRSAGQHRATRSSRRRVTVPASGSSAAGQHPQQRRLAAAVGADDADPGALAHLEVEAAQNRARAVGLDDVVEGDQRDRGAPEFLRRTGRGPGRGIL